jgi:DNA-binding PadR family transcriptional regulator
VALLAESPADVDDVGGGYASGEDLLEHRSLGATILRSWLLLMLADGPRHGYELVEDVWKLGPVVGSGHVYRTLRKMEATGLLASTWQGSLRGGTERRVYCLTPTGDEALAQHAEAVDLVAAQLRRYRRRYRALTQPGRHRAVPGGGRSVGRLP